MPIFPSREWCEAVIQALHADPETARAGLGWEGDVCAAVLPEPPEFDAPFAVYARPEGGRIVEFRVLEDLDEIEEIEPAYVARARYSTWKALIEGRFDPIRAILERLIQFQGDLEPIVQRAQFKDLLTRALARVPTTFVDSRR